MNDLQAVIEQLIADFLTSPPSRHSWTVDAVRAHQFLPLYFGWVATLGIRADGSMVRWDHEEGIDAVGPLDVDFLRRLAIKQGVMQYPALEALIPRPPPGSQPCGPCGGTGELKGAASGFICACGGLGWVIPGEEQGDSPG